MSERQGQKRITTENKNPSIKHAESSKFDNFYLYLVTREKIIMLANYGYKDASGDFFITINTDLCNGCGDCVTACPADILEIAGEDPNDPMRDEPVALVSDDKKNSLKYECNPCKPSSEKPSLPCVKICKVNAIEHSW